MVRSSATSNRQRHPSSTAQHRKAEQASTLDSPFHHTTALTPKAPEHSPYHIPLRPFQPDATNSKNKT